MSTGLLGFGSIQQRQGGVFEYISPSRLNCWIACPLRYELRYVQGLRTPTTPSLFLGKAVHAGLQVYYRHRQLGIALEAADVIRRLRESWSRLVDEEDMPFETPAEEQTLQRQALDLVTAYLTVVPQDERPLAVETSVEIPLIDPETGEDLGIPLLGIMDLVLQDEAGAIVADFKTTARSSEPLEIVHEIQLTSYAWLFRQANQQDEAGLQIRSLVKTKTPRIEIHHYPTRSEAHFRRLFAVIREYLDALDSGRFNYRPGFGCALCDFRDTHCRRWPGCSTAPARPNEFPQM